MIGKTTTTGKGSFHPKKMAKAVHMLGIHCTAKDRSHETKICEAIKKQQINTWRDQRRWGEGREGWWWKEWREGGRSRREEEMGRRGWREGGGTGGNRRRVACFPGRGCTWTGGAGGWCTWRPAAPLTPSVCRPFCSSPATTSTPSVGNPC